MGTRADFYIGRGTEAEWLGSIAWDGYPSGMGAELLHSRDEQGFRDRVAELAERDDFTSPEQGWPWPWDDSRTTDVAYAFDQGRVWFSWFGKGWMEADIWGAEPRGISDEWEERYEAAQENAEVTAFPHMAERRNLAAGTKRDSIMILTAKSKPEDCE